VRPTPEELDLIADALKARPNFILDKPEQFILMLAMIPSLDERLRVSNPHYRITGFCFIKISS